MNDNPVTKLVEQQSWLKPIAEKSDDLVEGVVGSAGSVTRDLLVNSRLFGHKKHPTITDVPLGSWTVTLVSDTLEMAGQEPCAVGSDVSLGVGLGASFLAALGGLADLSETHEEDDRQLGMMHGILHGATMLLYGGSFFARRTNNRGWGRFLSFTGYATLLGAAYLANELAERRLTRSA